MVCAHPPLAVNEPSQDQQVKQDLVYLPEDQDGGKEKGEVVGGGEGDRGVQRWKGMGRKALVRRRGGGRGRGEGGEEGGKGGGEEGGEGGGCTYIATK